MLALKVKIHLQKTQVGKKCDKVTFNKKEAMPKVCPEDLRHEKNQPALHQQFQL